MGTFDPFNLQRFVDAQEGVIEVALAELSAGEKRSHWMWFVFPQLAELGRSPTAKFYGIASIEEARAFLGHPLLGPRLRGSVEALSPWGKRRSAVQILGPIDALKLRSSLTLFDRVAHDGIFRQALLAFFTGEEDEHTLALLGAEQ